MLVELKETGFHRVRASAWIVAANDPGRDRRPDRRVQSPR